MKINIINVCNRLPTWVDEGIKEYHKRIKAPFDIHFHDIPLAKTRDNKHLLAEQDKMLDLSSKCYRIALDPMGQTKNTDEWASAFCDFEQVGKPISFIIGGPEGLSKTTIEQADESWSLSMLTFPHQLVKIILIEQIYRIWSLKVGHPYHK